MSTTFWFMPLDNGLDNPYLGVDGNPAHWYKGSLHAHSTVAEMYAGSGDNEEDKPRRPEAVLKDYADAGYHFVMLSEQDEYTTQDDIDKLNVPPGLIVIPGAELDGRRVDTGQHLSHANPDPNFHVPPYVPGQPKQKISDIWYLADRDPNKPLITQLHPQFPREDDGAEKNILGSKGVHALEVVNSWWLQRPHAFEDSGGKYSPFAFHLWDRLQKETGQQIWGVPGCCSVAKRDVNLSWIKVWLDQDPRTDPDPARSLMSAIRAGRFYFSSVSTPRDKPNDPAGPDNPTNKVYYDNDDNSVTIDEVKVGNGKVTIKTNAERVYAIVAGGPRLTVDPVPGSPQTFETFTFPDPGRFGPKGKYIRFECVGQGDDWNQSYYWDNTQQLNRSWTQPLWIPPIKPPTP